MHVCTQSQGAEKARKSALGPPCIVCSQEEEAAAAGISEPLLSACLEAQLRLPVTWYSHKELNAGLWSVFLAVTVTLHIQPQLKLGTVFTEHCTDLST